MKERFDLSLLSFWITELFSLGEEPYSLVNDGDVDTYVQNLIDGDRLKKPDYATNEMYVLINFYSIYQLFSFLSFW